MFKLVAGAIVNTGIFTEQDVNRIIDIEPDNIVQDTIQTEYAELAGAIGGDGLDGAIAAGRSSIKGITSVVETFKDGIEDDFGGIQ